MNPFAHGQHTCMVHVAMIPTIRFCGGIFETTSQNLLSYQWLTIPGNCIVGYSWTRPIGMATDSWWSRIPSPIRSLTSVYSPVNLYTALLRESLLTNITLIRLEALVYPLMSQQVWLQREFLVTNITVMWLNTCMHLHMSWNRLNMWVMSMTLYISDIFLIQDA